MVVKYTIDRKDLYNGYYDDAKKEIINGRTKDKLNLSPVLPVLYRIIKKLRRLERKKCNEK